MLGIINLNKPVGKTSHDMVNFVRRTLGERRVGHAGTLDPVAGGVLPILVGKATSLSDLLIEKTKIYIAEVRLGLATDTYDTTGTVTKRCDMHPSPAEIQAAADSFLGDSMQLPPMYSAVKVGGRKLYDLARQGMTIERTPRPIHVSRMRCFNFTEGGFSLEVICSKGTYIRTLCHDLGERLGGCACMAGLLRTQSGPFLLNDAVTPDELAQKAAEGSLQDVLLPPETVLSVYPHITIPKDAAPKIRNGLRMRPKQLGIAKAAADDRFCLYDDASLLCLAKAVESTEGLVLAIEKSFY